MISPLTRLLSTTCGASTEPSTTPCSLTESEASDLAVARTLPVMRPSTCRPPANSTSPCTLALLPISVSMRPTDSLSRRLNMLISATRASTWIHGPDERSPVGHHALALGSDLDRDAIRLEISRQCNRLIDAGGVTKIESQLVLAAGQRCQVGAGRAAIARAVHGDAEYAADRLAGPLQPAQAEAQREFQRARQRRDVKLLHPDDHCFLLAGLRQHAAIELDILLLGFDLRLQLADGTRQFRALAHFGHAAFLGRRQLYPGLALALLQMRDLHLQRLALGRRLHRIVASLVAAEFEGDIQRQAGQQHHDRQDDPAPRGRVGTDDQPARNFHRLTESSIAPGAPRASAFRGACATRPDRAARRPERPADRTRAVRAYRPRA